MTYSDKEQTRTLHQIDEMDNMHVTTSEKPEKSEKLSMREHLCSWRGVTYFLLHFTFIAWCIPRSATSMAFVCANSRREGVLRMLNASASADSPDEEYGHLDLGENSSSRYNFSGAQLDTFRHVLADLNWSSDTQGLVLAAPLVLSFVGPVLSDLVTRRTGTRLMFSVVQLFNGAVMAASPSLARSSPYLLMAAHIVLGLTINLNFPIIATLLTRWTPLKQKLVVASLVYTGPTMGGVVTSLLNGYLCAVPVDNGWPFLFYTAAALHVLYALAWYVCIGEFPETHRFISRKEADYIVTRRASLSTEGQS
ncbi:hypothetical protein EGW08_022261, partial [Elysia chlorotica]